MRGDGNQVEALRRKQVPGLVPFEDVSTRRRHVATVARVEERPTHRLSTAAVALEADAHVNLDKEVRPLRESALGSLEDAQLKALDVDKYDVGISVRAR